MLFLDPRIEIRNHLLVTGDPPNVLCVNWDLEPKNGDYKCSIVNRTPGNRRQVGLINLAFFDLVLCTVREGNGLFGESKIIAEVASSIAQSFELAFNLR